MTSSNRATQELLLLVVVAVGVGVHDLRLDELVSGDVGFSLSNGMAASSAKSWQITSSAVGKSATSSGKVFTADSLS